MTNCPGCGHELIGTLIRWKNHPVEQCYSALHGMNGSILWGFDGKKLVPLGLRRL